MDINHLLPVFRLVLNDELDGVTATSLVSEPAHEAVFHAFASDKPIQLKFSATDKVKRNVTGPIMVPNKLIYRFDLLRGEHYVLFTDADVEAAAHRMGKQKTIGNVSVDHAPELLDGAYPIEFWRTHVANERGLGHPVNTLMSTQHIEDEGTWARIESGELTGFSIEGFFTYRPIQMSKEREREHDAFDVMRVMCDATLTDEQKEATIKNMFPTEEQKGISGI